MSIPERLPIDAANLSLHAAKAQQEYVVDRDRRYGFSAWIILAALLFGLVVIAWVVFR